MSKISKMSKIIPIIISIEGNIGAGKSSLLNKIKKYENNEKGKKFCILKEPVDIWESINDKCGDIEYGYKDENILQRFYKDPKKYAFSFQIMAYITRLKLLEDAIKNDYEIIIMERCLEIDENVFIKMLNDNESIDKYELQIYKLFVNILQEIKPQHKINAVIYLDVSPQQCLERINKRGRLGEEDINLDYLNNCEFYHKKWLETIDNTKTDVLRIKNDTEENNPAEIIFNYLEKIV